MTLLCLTRRFRPSRKRFLRWSARLPQRAAMPDKHEFDFWYAVNNTEIVLQPQRQLETFGATMVDYHLISQLMDNANQVRVREGRLQAFRPEIITPRSPVASGSFLHMASDARRIMLNEPTKLTMMVLV